jgi:hypothetical protein
MKLTRTLRLAPLALLLCAALFTGPGCQSTYYNTMEKFGVAKRDILVDRIKAARNAQQVTKEQFNSALDQFRSTVAMKAGISDEKYYELNASFQRCQHRATTLNQRIESVEDVAEALFAEWSGELKQYNSVTLRKESETKMFETRRRYTDLIRQMKLAAAKVDPVLVIMHDRVLFLKHNLNAQSIASLDDELKRVETEVGSLVREMEKAIADADAFVQAMPIR